MKALILCAGKGIRMGYKTKPKCMARVNKKPVLEHIIDHLNKAGIDQIIVNVSKDHEAIFKYFGTRVLYLYEPVLLGTAGTEHLLSDWLGEAYVVVNGDTITNVDLKQMITMGQDERATILFFKERYGGTKFVNGKEVMLWDGDGAFYYDCGSPKKLARARRYLK